MLQIIPAIDIIDGKCVRLTKGDYSTKKEYRSNPVEVAKEFEDSGIKRLHLVDLDGAKAKEIINLKTLEKIANQTNLWIDFGGGVQSASMVDSAFQAGAKQITAGSIAVRNQELVFSWLEKYGPDKIIIGADTHQGHIAVSGWEENSGIELNDFLQPYVNKGVEYIISTDVAKDGLLEGPNIPYYKKMAKDFPNLNIIASGGVSSLSDLFDLKELSIFGVIVGKAIYEGKITLIEIKKLMEC